MAVIFNCRSLLICFYYLIPTQYEIPWWTGAETLLVGRFANFLLLGDCSKGLVAETSGRQEEMSDPRPQSLFFVTVPELQRLCAVRVTLCRSGADAEARSTQLKMCRWAMRSAPTLPKLPETCKSCFKTKYSFTHSVYIIVKQIQFCSVQVQRITFREGLKMLEVDCPTDELLYLWLLVWTL